MRGRSQAEDVVNGDAVRPVVHDVNQAPWGNRNAEDIYENAEASVDKANDDTEDAVDKAYDHTTEAVDDAYGQGARALTDRRLADLRR